MPVSTPSRLRASVVGALALCATFALVLPASATSRPHLVAARSFVVNSTSDALALNPASGLCTTSLGKCTLRAAVNVANALGSPVNVIVPAGTYSLSIGAIVVTDPMGVTVVGKSSSTTVISGAFADRVFDVGRAVDFGGSSYQGSRLILQNLAAIDGSSKSSTPSPTSEGGGVLVRDVNDFFNATNVRFQSNTAGDATHNGYGGAIYSNGTTTINNCTFNSNTATQEGGAIFTNNGLLTVTGSTFTGNSAYMQRNVEAKGGAIYVGAPANILNSKFTSNVAANTSSSMAEGGAIYIGEETVLTGDTFNANEANALGSSNAEGGAVVNHYSATIATSDTFTNNTASGHNALGGAWYSGANTTMNLSKFSNNTASGTSNAQGGAIYNESGYTSMSITATSFTANKSVSGGTTTDQGGGAIYDTGAATISTSSFNGNIAQNGNGGALWNAGDGDVITNSTFTNNSATGGAYAADGAAGYGGALYLYDTSIINDSSIVGNHASQGGGGLYSDDGNTVNDTLIKSNTANQGGGMYLDWLVVGERIALVDNVASGLGASGGGVFIRNNTGDLVAFSGSTVTGNVAPVGAGFAFGTSAVNVGSGSISGTYVGGNHTAAGVTSECFYSGTNGYPLGSAAQGNVAGDSSCQLGGPADRQGSTAQGYWFSTSGGHVTAKQATTFGAAGSVAAMAAGPGNSGYFTVSPTGAVKGFGTAKSFGNATGKLAGGTAVALLTTLDRQGYWVVSSTGAVAAFGDAKTYGQHVGVHVVAAARSVNGHGYWLVTSSGSVLNFGDAKTYGGHAGAVAIASTPDGQGYWLVSATGAVSHFGDAGSYGSTSTSGVIGIASSPDGHGYLIFTKTGKVIAKGNAHSSGNASGSFAAVAAS